MPVWSMIRGYIKKNSFFGLKKRNKEKKLPFSKRRGKKKLFKVLYLIYCQEVKENEYN